MRHIWSNSRGALVAAAVMAGAGLMTAGDALAAGRGGVAGGVRGGLVHGRFVSRPAIGRAGYGRNRFGEGGRFGGDRRRRYGGYGLDGFGLGGFGSGDGFAVVPGSFADEVAPRGWRDPAICCGPMAPVAIGIRAAPVAPPTTYVVGSSGGFRRGAMNRSAIRTGPLVADSGGAGQASVVDPTLPRVIRLR